MKTENEHIDNLTRQFMQGDITAEGLCELNDFVRQSEENRQYVRNLRELFFDRAATKAHEEFDVEQALHRFLAHVHEGEAGEAQANKVVGKDCGDFSPYSSARGRLLLGHAKGKPAVCHDRDIDPKRFTTHHRSARWQQSKTQFWFYHQVLTRLRYL